MTFLTCISHHVRLHLCYVLTSELLDSLEGERLHFIKEAQTTSQSDHRRLRFLNRVEAAALTHTLLEYSIAGHRECFHANNYKVESSAEMVSTPTCLAIMSFVLRDAPASPFTLGISNGSEGLLDRILSAFDTHHPLVLCSFSSYFLFCFFRRELLTLNAVESSSPEIYATTFNFTFSSHCQS